ADARGRRSGRHSRDRVRRRRSPDAPLRRAHRGRRQRRTRGLSLPLRRAHRGGGEGLPRRAGRPGPPLSMAGGGLDATAVLYADVFRRGAVLALRNWAVGLIVLLYLAILTGVAVAMAPFGFAGGFVRYLAEAACFSSGLSLVEQAIRARRVTLADIP